MDTWEDEPASTGRTLELVDRPGLVEVRRWAGRTLEELADQTREELQDVLLVVNELTANAYEHGGRRCDCACRVWVTFRA